MMVVGRMVDGYRMVLGSVHQRSLCTATTRPIRRLAIVRSVGRVLAERSEGGRTGQHRTTFCVDCCATFPVGTGRESTHPLMSIDRQVEVCSSLPVCLLRLGPGCDREQQLLSFASQFFHCCRESPRFSDP
jgi:hypothetical protein